MDWTGADAVLRAQLEDAQRDVRLWLACTLSNEERLYVRGIHGRLAALEQIEDHQIIAFTALPVTVKRAVGTKISALSWIYFIRLQGCEVVP
jgi:hypothetical protein